MAARRYCGPADLLREASPAHLLRGILHVAAAIALLQREAPFGRRGLQWEVPDEADRQTVHDMIFGELCLGVFTGAARAAYVEVIERQTQHLTRLVDDLLDVSRITRGMVMLRREPVQLAAVIQRSIETR